MDSTSSSAHFFSCPALDTPLQYYAISGLSGVLSCGLTHFLAHPHKNVKCCMQIDPATYSAAYRTTSGLFASSFPRAIGYGLKGLHLPGLEFVKGLRDPKSSERLYLCGTAAVAVLLVNAGTFYPSPAKMHTAGPKGITRLLWSESAYNYIKHSTGKNRCRLENHTMVQFQFNELAVDVLYAAFKPKADCSKAEQSATTFTAGYIAGIACAIVTHPAELLEYKGLAESGFRKAVQHLGFRGLWAGFLPRSCMIGTIAALQWTIYDGVKSALYNPPSTATPAMSESLRKKVDESKMKEQ